MHPVDGQQQRGDGVDDEAEVVDLHPADHVAQPAEADDQHARHDEVAEDHPQQVEGVGRDQRIEVDAPEDVGHRDDRDRGVERRQQHGQRRVGERHPLVAVGIDGAHSRRNIQVACTVCLSIWSYTGAHAGHAGHDRAARPRAARDRRPRSSAGCAPSPGRRSRSSRCSAASTARGRRASATSPPPTACARSRWRRRSATSRRRGLVSRRPDPHDGRRSLRRADRRRARDAARHPRAARGLADPDAGPRARRRRARAAAPGAGAARPRGRRLTAPPVAPAVSSRRAARPGEGRGRPRSSRVRLRALAAVAVLAPRGAKSALACWTAPSSRWRRSSSAPAVTALTVTVALVTFVAPHALPAARGARGWPARAWPTRRSARPSRATVRSPPLTSAEAQSIDACGCSFLATRGSIRAPPRPARCATSCSARRFHSALSARHSSSVRVRFQ